MDGPRFERLVRSFADPGSRRGLLGGTVGLAAALAGARLVNAACPPGQVHRRGSCLCRATGRAPVGGVCPCPEGQIDTGDGLGCLDCRGDEECGDEICCDNVCRAWTCCSNDECAGGLCCKGVCQQCCKDTDCVGNEVCHKGECDCFIAGTRIAMVNGAWRPIELVEVGDYVLGSNGHANRVLGVHRPLLGHRSLYSFNGGPFFVTAAHPFLTMNGWEAIDSAAARQAVPGLAIEPLNVGDQLVALAAARVPALAGGSAWHGGVEIERTSMPLGSLIGRAADPATPLFSLKIDGDHTYFADELLVHNK